MDQIYIPKNRTGFFSGDYVLIQPIESKLKGRLEEKKDKTRLYFYGVKALEPIKLRVIEEISSLISREANPENIIITGSFLEQGFNFNDLDILIINKQKINTQRIRSKIENLTGIKTHIIMLDKKTLISGMSSDPLYTLMLSRCMSKNRLIFKVERKINYKLLDLHLLKSKTLIDNFSILSGNEKYYLILNMVSILLFIQNKKLSKEIVNKEIEKIFCVKISEIRANLITKKDFIEKYKEIYNKTFNLILKNVKTGK